MALPFAAMMALQAAPAVANGIGGVVGHLAGGEDRAREEEMLKRMMAEYGGLEVPQLQKLQDTRLSTITQDPRLRDAEYRALDQFQSMIDGGGHTLQDKAVLNNVQNQVARSNSQGMAAIRENMAARGIGGGGAELAMSLQNQQGGAQRMNEAGMDNAARAQSRYYDAVMARGRQAGQMSDRDYNKQADAARSQDLINQYNNNLPGRQFQMNMDKTRMMGNAYQNMGGYYGNRGRQTGQMIQGAVGGAAGGAAAAGNAANQYQQPQSGFQQEDPYGNFSKAPEKY